MGMEPARSWFDWSDSVETLDEIGAHHERVLLPQQSLAADDLHAIALPSADYFPRILALPAWMILLS